VQCTGAVSNLPQHLKDLVMHDCLFSPPTEQINGNICAEPRACEYSGCPRKGLRIRHHEASLSDAAAGPFRKS